MRCATVPRKIRRLLEACLQKDPNRRLQAIGDRHLLLLEPERQHVRWLWPAITGATALSATVLGDAHTAPPHCRHQLAGGPEQVICVDDVLTIDAPRCQF